MENLIRLVYGKDNVTLAEVNGKLVRNYEMHLKVVRSCQANTVIRYMKCFKKVIHMALANEWMTKDELDILIKKNSGFRVWSMFGIRSSFVV